MNRRVLLFTLLLSISLLSVRWFSDFTGYPSFQWDYGSHLVILHEFARGNWFPELANATHSPHIVASWLPLYHGILGAHIFAATLMKVFSLTGPKAMLITVDISLAIYLSVAIAAIFDAGSIMNRIIATIGLVGISIPAFISATHQGFFSQATSFGYYTLSIWLLRQKKFKSSMLAVCFAGLTYPDALIWLLPILTLTIIETHSPRKLLNSALPALFGVLIPIALLTELICRTPLSGGIEANYVDLGLLLILCWLTWQPLLQDWIMKGLIFGYLSMLFILALVSLALDSSLSYYVLKTFYWSALLLPFLISSISLSRNRTYVILSVVICALLLTVYQEKLPLVPTKDYFTANSIFSDHDERQIYNLLKTNKCSTTIVLPGSLAIDQESTLILSTNAISHGVVPHSLEFTRDLKVIAGSPFELASSLSKFSANFKAQLIEKNISTGCRVNCFIYTENATIGLKNHWVIIGPNSLTRTDKCPVVSGL
jgi:hypothetical protein